MGSLIHWLLDLSLSKPRAASSSMQRSIGIVFVIMFKGSPGEDGRAPVIRIFASLWTLLSLARFCCLSTTISISSKTCK